MNFKQVKIPVVMASALALVLTCDVFAGEGKALSFFNFENQFLYPDNDNDGVPDADVGLMRVSPPIPQSGSVAQKLGAGMLGPQVPICEFSTFDNGQACVGRNIDGDEVATDDPVCVDDGKCPLDCPDENFFEQVIIPDDPFFGNFSRADPQVRPPEDFVSVLDGCPGVVGNTSCRTPGAIVGECGGDASSIAEVQFNKDGDFGDSEASFEISATFMLDPATNPQPTALTAQLEIDWCREVILTDIIPVSQMRADLNFQYQLFDSDSGILVFDAKEAFFEVFADIDGETVTNDPNTTISADIRAPDNMIGTVCEFPRPDFLGLAPPPGFEPSVVGKGFLLRINTNPDGLNQTDCDNLGTACFIAQPGQAYDFNLFAGTDVDGVVHQSGVVDVHKCYWGKQNGPFSEEFPELPNPVIDSVLIKDQFFPEGRFAVAEELWGICNPAIKNNDEPFDEDLDDHWTIYDSRDARNQDPRVPVMPQEVDIFTENFGNDTIEFDRRATSYDLLLPAIKNGDGTLRDGVAYKCYGASSTLGDPNLPQDVTLDDQFFEDEPTTIRSLKSFCLPAGKDDAPIPDDLPHLACYAAPQVDVRFIPLLLEDQFIQETVQTEIEFDVELFANFRIPGGMCEKAEKLEVRW